MLRPSLCPDYLLVVFGGGVLLLPVGRSQPRLSPRVGAGAAHRPVCRAVPAGLVSAWDTVRPEVRFQENMSNTNTMLNSYLDSRSC